MRLSFVFAIDFRFVCPIEKCDKEYRTQWELNFHCRKKHSPDTPKKFSCCYNECGIEFATNNDLTAHYELMHATTVQSGKRKPKLKRANGKKCATTNTPRIIYVLPGPVDKTVMINIDSLRETISKHLNFSHRLPKTERLKPITIIR